MIALLLDHLWQSSLFAGFAGLLVFVLRKNSAGVRFWLWFAASVKFLLPFALLTALGGILLAPVAPPIPAPGLLRMQPVAKPFSTATQAIAPPVMVPSERKVRSQAPAPALVSANFPAINLNLTWVLLALWLAGFVAICVRWLVGWARLRALLGGAEDLDLNVPVGVKVSASRLEPGLVGILRPVILLPLGIEQQLSRAEMDAVLAHELCHWRRRDNLLSAFQMLVEALFWFIPLVWWLGARMNAERERACDESVLAEGNDPQAYAQGILKVCRAYLQSPLACVAGVSGGDLKARIDAIMDNRRIPRLNAPRKLLLSASAALVLAVPLALALAVVPVAQIQAKTARVLAPIAQIVAPATAPPSEPAPSQTTASALPVQAHSQTESLAPPAPDLSGALSYDTLVTPAIVASNEGRAATVTDQPAASAQPAASGLIQASLADSATAKPGSHEAPTAYSCRNTKIFGRVISSEAIQMQGFRCFIGGPQAGEVQYGSCPLLSTAGPSFISTGTRLRHSEDDALSQGPRLWSRGRGSCPFDVTMNVKFADPAEASKMQLGKMLKLAGDFRVVTEDHIVYLTVNNAKVIWVDQFNRPSKPNRLNSNGPEIEAFYNGAPAPHLNMPSPSYR